MRNKMARQVSVYRCAVALISATALAVSACGPIYCQEPPRVAQVAITGNQNINTDAIQHAITLKSGDDYTEAAVEKDRAAIMSLGYFSAVTVHRDDTPEGLRVTYEVTENPKITDVKVLGSEPVRAAAILDLMKTKSGQVLNATTLNQDIEAIQTHYTEQGYIAYVTEDIGVDPQTGVLTVPILVYRVESVEVTGNKKTRTYVFLREMKTRPGEVFNVNVLKQDIVRIFSLDILEDITYQINPGAEIGTVRITLPIVEKKTGQISVGFGYSSRQRLVGQARLSENNFRGTGQGLNVLFERGSSNAVGGGTSYEVGYMLPWIDKRHTSLSFSVFNKVIYRFTSGVFEDSAFEDEDTYYNERHKGFDVTLSRPITERTRVYLGSRFEQVETDEDLLRLADVDVRRIIQTGDVISGSLRLVHNKRDFDLDPAHGHYEGVMFEFGKVDGNRFTETLTSIPVDGTFNKFSIDLRRYFPLAGGPKRDIKDKRTVIAVRLRAGIANGELPFFEQFFIGGGESLRGYREDRFWGDKMMLLSVEFRKPIAQSITGRLFVDYGDAWGGNPAFSITELPQHQSFDGNFGAGVGMGISTPIGNLRLDYGVGSEGGRTHFSMGHSF